MEKTYKVIEILNKKELLINYGENDGAKKGQHIRISDRGESVKDPETGEELGTLDVIKGTLEIYAVYPEFSICRDITRYERELLHGLGLKTKTETVYHPLNVEDGDITNRWPKPIPPIKVGDIIELL